MYGFGKSPDHWRTARLDPVFNSIEEIIRFLQKSECLYTKKSRAIESDPRCDTDLIIKCCMSGKVLYCTHHSEVSNFFDFLRNSSEHQMALLQIIQGLVILSVCVLNLL